MLCILKWGFSGTAASFMFMYKQTACHITLNDKNIKKYDWNSVQNLIFIKQKTFQTCFL